MKFKVGDQVRVVGKSKSFHFFDIGDIVEIVAIGQSIVDCKKGDLYQIIHANDIEPVTSSKVTKITPYMRKKYMLLKDTPETKKGAIFEEMCDDGTQDFQMITPEFNKFSTPGEVFEWEVVTNNPKWFKEVTLIYVAKEQVKKVEKFIKKLL